MANRITAKFVDNHIARINKRHGFDTVNYGTIGAIQLDSSYNYYNIQKITSAGGSVSTLFTGTIAECEAFLCGIDASEYGLYR